MMLSHVIVGVICLCLGAVGAFLFYPARTAKAIPCVVQGADAGSVQVSGVPTLRAGPDEVTRPISKALSEVQMQAAAARDQAKEATDRADWAEGQLEAVEGKPSLWPANVPAAFKPDAFKSQLQEFVVAKGLGKVAEVDCTEFPCIATIEMPKDVSAAVSTDKLHQALGALAVEQYHRVALSISATLQGDRPVALVSFAPADDADTAQRTKHRTQVLMEEP